MTLNTTDRKQRIARQQELHNMVQEALYYHRRMQNSATEGMYDYNFNNRMWSIQEARRIIAAKPTGK